MKHYSVMLHETIDCLKVKPDGIYVDGTLGRAGHSRLILSQLTSGHLFGFDKDLQALEESKQLLTNQVDKITFIHSDFCHMKQELNQRGIDHVDGVILDLGVSSPQFDDANRGFSYRYDSRLDMRMDQTQSISAYEIVNEYAYSDLVRILYQYGEEKFAKQIARSIERNRAIKPIETTGQLVDVIKQALPMKVLNKKGHPAKKTFQALRIEVNSELDSLKQGLSDACEMLNVNGRCCVLTFQSLEDRIVKELFNELSTAPYVDPKIPLLPSQMEQPSFLLVNKKPIIASEEELAENNRSHSAKLRAIERIKE